ncbi:MAG: hypothetical protein JWL84_3574 [Rhodospirillales bacterium]|jgi:hypothetical protein|nr:hypothetical protein [Rhodospirillales bacterium]
MASATPGKLSRFVKSAVPARYGFTDACRPPASLAWVVLPPGGHAGIVERTSRAVGNGDYPIEGLSIRSKLSCSKRQLGPDHGS